MTEDNINRRNLKPLVTKPEQQTVLFGHAVKAPGVIRLVQRQIADRLHPMATPGAWIEIGDHTKWLLYNLRQRLAHLGPGDQLGATAGVGVQKKADLLPQLPFQSVGSTPLKEEAALVLFSEVVVLIREAEVAEAAVAEAQLDLPPRHVRIHDCSMRSGDQRRAGADDHGELKRIRCRDLRTGRFQQIGSKVVGNGNAVHVAKHAVIRQVRRKEGAQLILASIQFAHIDDLARKKTPGKFTGDFIDIRARITFDAQHAMVRKPLCNGGPSHGTFIFRPACHERMLVVIRLSRHQ